MKYTDHFKESPGDYLQFRPSYPDELFSYLASLTPQHDIAWDCGTGNGQAANYLAHYFQLVIATDIHQAQLDSATPLANINYQQAPAEKTNITDLSIDLITVAQALHWFDLSRFYEEAKRVLKPDGIIAAWCYSLGKIDIAIDRVIKKLYLDILDPYWPEERHYIDAEYTTISFPFSQIISPSFEIKKEMNFEQLLGYLNTWSAVKEYQKQHHENPVRFILSELEHTWGQPNVKRAMRWPIHLLVGKKEESL